MLRRTGIGLMSFLSLFAAASAADKLTVQSALDSALKNICTTGTILTCPVMDFIVSFGVVFAVLYMSVNLIPQASSEEAKKALSVFAVIAAFATAIYVYMMHVPFVSFIAPAMLFIAGLIIVLTVINAAKAFWEKGKGGGPSWKTIMAIIGFMLIGIGIILINVKEISAEFPQANDIGSLLITVGVILLIIAFLLWLATGIGVIAGGGGGRGGGGGAPPRRGRIDVQPEGTGRGGGGRTGGGRTGGGRGGGGRRQPPANLQMAARRLEIEIINLLKDAFQLLQRGPTGGGKYTFRGERRLFNKLWHFVYLEVKHPTWTPQKRIAVIMKEIHVIHDIIAGLTRNAGPATSLNQLIAKLQSIANRNAALARVLVQEMQAMGTYRYSAHRAVPQMPGLKISR